MRTLLFLITSLSGTLALAQGPSFGNQQRTTGAVGITAGQSARLTVLYATAPAPILQPTCPVTLDIADDQGKVLKSSNTPQLIAGKSVSVDLNADTDLTAVRTQIHGFSITTNGCNLVTSLEIVDNPTQKTVIVVGSQVTYPAISAVLPNALGPR
jgi:hypothetical protein